MARIPDVDSLPSVRETEIVPAGVRRMDLLGAIVTGPVSRVGGAVLSILGVIATVREIALPEATQAKLNFYRIWSLDWPWWLWVIVVLSVALVILFEGAYRIVRKLRDRIAVLEKPEAPDVRLEGTFPGTFVLHAYGHACEIRTGPIILEKSLIGTHKDGDQTYATWYPRATIEFPFVSDLHDDAKDVEPSLFYDEGYSRNNSRWPDTEVGAAMTEFIRAATLVRRGPVVDFNTLSETEIETIIEHREQPFHFSFDITFWNGDHTQQWRRDEALVYEPKTGVAFVRHGAGPSAVTLFGSLNGTTSP